MSKDDNIIIYLLISSLDPPQKIFELINSVDQNAYVQAHEIFNNYVNLLKDDEIKSKRVKIPLDDNHAFHVFISEQALIFISYTNTISNTYHPYKATQLETKAIAAVSLLKILCPK